MQPCISAIVFFLAVHLASCNKERITQTDDKSSTYKLVWSDEFETDGPPNPANWSFEQGFVRNQELQWYQPDNARCENGLLVIEAKRERVLNLNYNPGSLSSDEKRQYAEYTSSSLLTRGKHNWMFGRFEMRARIDTRPGLWPAFWTLGVNGDWPHCGEVDIMEYYQGTVLANIAWGAEQKWQAIWDDFRKPISELGGTDWAKNFHVWRMDWDRERISLYLDDVLMNTANLSDTFNRDTEGKNPFWQPHSIIVNLAIGGTAGGDPSQTIFPAYYEIDYIRVYQK